MNKFIFMGRLTREPEIRYAGQMEVANFSLAVDRRFKKDGEDPADFFNCTAFGKLAQFTEKYLTKGTKIVCSGRVQNDNYTDKNSNKRYSMQFIVDEIEFAESKKAGADQKAETNSDDFMNIPEGVDDCELPFV